MKNVNAFREYEITMLTATDEKGNWKSVTDPFCVFLKATKEILRDFPTSIRVMEEEPNHLDPKSKSYTVLVTRCHDTNITSKYSSMNKWIGIR